MTERPAGAVGGHLLCLATNPSIDRLLEVSEFRIATIHRPTAAWAVAGGKGLNVARSAATLGAAVRVVGILAGHAGRWIADELDRLGIGGDFLWVAGETRTCVSILDRRSGRLTEFYEPGPPVADRWETFVGLVERALARGPAVVTISGSLPPGAPVDGLAVVCSLAARAGIPVIVDSHGEALSAALETAPWLVKINATEAAGLTGMRLGGERSALVATTAIARRAGFGAIVTRGARPAIAVSRAGSWSITPPQVEARYSVGSGDAFLGGLAVAIAAGESFAAALRLAAAAGAANAARPGAGEIDATLARSLASSVRLSSPG